MEKSEEITSFTLSELRTLAEGHEDRQIRECLIAHNSAQLEAFRFPCRIDAIIIGIGTEGDTTVSINLEEHRLRKNDLFFYTPRNIIQVHSNDHFKAHCIAITSSFAQRLNIDTARMVPLFMLFASKPVLPLTDEESQALRGFLTQIELHTRTPDAPFAKEILGGLINAMLYKMGAILQYYLAQHPQEHVSTKNRAEEYFRQFMLLLSRHYKTERSVGFYARQLYITPKYLTTLIRRISNKSVSEWIDSYVVLEAKTLLKYSNMSIQEIAYALNFPNQSFFGSYFKRNTGMSPSQYKLQL